MGVAVEVGFDAFEVTGVAHPPAFAVTAEPEGDIVVRGGLSASHGRWVLSARAVRKRRQITLQITALTRSLDTEAGLQDMGYEARLTGLAPGSYELRLSHSCRIADAGTALGSICPLQVTVVVPSESRCVTPGLTAEVTSGAG
jgi:hypothetical protein